MLNSPILEVAIGMIFFYLLLSLICSALNEIIEAALQNRANDLENGVRRLLDDPDPKAANFFANARRRIARLFLSRSRWATSTPTGGLASRLYNHGFIRSLYRDAHSLPAYIPARNFALALMDIIAPGQHGTAGATRPSPATQPATVIITGNSTPPVAPAPLQPPCQLREAVQDPRNVPSAIVRDALLAIIEAADNDPVRIRENIENWFNNTTDRISGWYKRRTQFLILTLGIGLAVVLNADTVLVLNSLWSNAALRESVATEAQGYVAQINASQSGGVQTPGPGNIRALKTQLYQLGLPIGWNAQDAAHTLPGFLFGDPRRVLSWTMYQLDLHWLGWMLTGMAISLGAPFWFDLLNKFIVVRSTVKPREKSPEDASKD